MVGSGPGSAARLRTAIDKARAGAPPPAPETAPSSAATPVSLPPPSTAEDYYRVGSHLRTTHDLRGAIKAFDQALALRKDWPLALAARANCYYQLKEYDAAIASLNRAIELDPKRMSYYDERGLAYSYSGRHAEALPDYTRAIELTPESAAPYNNRGWANLELGRLDESRRDLDHAIELSPTYQLALHNRARLFLMQKQYAKAIADYEAVLRVNPSDQPAINGRANAQRLMSGATPLMPPKQLSPPHGVVYDHFPRETTLVWTEVPGAASYRAEWEFQSEGSWAPGTILSAAQPVASFRFVGAQPGRWRVWAVDAAGVEGPKSEWREFRYTK
jgi:tetratricopeptide (TPR) repeat protein